MDALLDETLLATCRSYELHQNQYTVAKELDISQACVSRHLAEARKRGIWREKGGSVAGTAAKVEPTPKKGTRKVFYLTCAQDHTKLHETCWANLMALVEEDSATLKVSTFKYNKDAQGQRFAAKYENTFDSRAEELAAMYPAEILPYIDNERVDLSPNLTWCGELNVLPTASNPLEGLENYTYRKSTIVPHPKLAMTSIPTMKSEGVKLMYTTGCVTQKNYIARKVGFKAEHFHTYGALIVEIDDRGYWYVRQVVLGQDGSMYDLNRRAKDGVVEHCEHLPAKIGANGLGQTYVEDICWGDIHAQKLDEELAELSFGHHAGSMLETLRPRKQHVHDLLDFSGRSHHTRRNPHQVFESFTRGTWGLQKELELTAGVLWNRIARPWCETVVVNSNHDRHLERWLQEADWRFDPANAKLNLALNLLVLQSIEANRKYNLTEAALSIGYDKIETPQAGCLIRFLAEDESDILLPKIDGGIEAGLHGDRGANGAKGSLVTFAKADRKTNTADKHWAGIDGNAYQCGLTGKLDQGYNHGLSNWTAADIITYVNGTRCIISPWKGKWRA